MYQAWGTGPVLSRQGTGTMRPRPWLDDTGGWPAAKGGQVTRAEVHAGTARAADPADLYPADRIGLAAAAAARAGIGALLLTPGPDLRYLTGYDAMPTERLTCLAVASRRVGCSWSRRGSSCGRCRPRPPAAWAWRSWAGTRPTIRTAWSRTGSAARSRSGWPTRCGPRWCSGSVMRCRAPARGGQRRPARAADPQDPRRGRGAAGGGGGDRPGAWPGSGLAPARPDRARDRRRHRRDRHDTPAGLILVIVRAIGGFSGIIDTPRADV